jgi:hypothetical protein
MKPIIDLNLKKLFCFLVIILFVINCNYSQNNIQNDSLEDMIAMDAPVGATERNSPNFGSSECKIIPCRKESLKNQYFFPDEYHSCEDGILRDPTIVSFQNIDYNDRENLCCIVYKTKDMKYFGLVRDLILYDSSYYYHNIRMDLAKCLSQFKNIQCEEFLIYLLKGKNQELSTIAAICLLQLESYEIAYDFFSNSYYNFDYCENVYSALAQINSVQSIEILKKIVSYQNNPYLKMDGLAALSLMGYCDYAYNGFKRLIDSKDTEVKTTAIRCIAYYTATIEAFNFIRTLKDEKDVYIKQRIEEVLDFYDKQMLKK